MGQRKRTTCKRCDEPDVAFFAGGLCSGCYLKPGARVEFPPAVVAKQPPSHRSPGRPPRDATTARPGSPDKVEVMRQRAARGESCFHQNDAR